MSAPIPAPALARIERALPAILNEFGTPCYVYDEQGILDRGRELQYAMRQISGFQQFYAVKAWNNPANLLLQQRMGFGFDCSSPYEMDLIERIGAQGRFILTSNNSRPEWFKQALRLGGIINLDDISLIRKVQDFPKIIAFRLNPGERKSGGDRVFSAPRRAKYGIMWEQLVPAYRRAMARGAIRFGLHTMVRSNCRDEDYLVDTLQILLEAIGKVEQALGIEFEFVNPGGGFGVPYHPRKDGKLNINRIGERFAGLLDGFRLERGYAPRLYTEMGRWMTAPFGVLVTKVINRKEIYETHVGVDVGMEGLVRPAMYGAYHHIKVFGAERRRTREVVNVVGSICEDCDRLATHRLLPKTREGDILLVFCGGAHAWVMCGNYNGKTRVQEVMLRASGQAELIRRAETHDDLDATLRFEPKIVPAY